MTFRQLKEELEKLNDKQLDQPVILSAYGVEAGEGMASPGDALDFDVADFDLYYYESYGNTPSGYPAISLEELKKEEGDDFDEDNVEMSGVKKGMPFFFRSWKNQENLRDRHH